MKSVLAFALVALAATTVRAQAGPADEAQARERFRRGEKLSGDGQYREALREFDEGYRLSRRPLFLFNMAECARLAGNPARARWLYQRYLAEDPRGTLAKEARERLAALPPAARSAPPPGPAPVTPEVVPPPPPTQPSPHTSLDLTVRDRGPERAPRPAWKRWPFWAAVGTAVVVATVTTIAVTIAGGGRTTPGGDMLVDWRR